MTHAQIIVGLAAWLLVSLPLAIALGRVFAINDADDTAAVKFVAPVLFPRQFRQHSPERRTDGSGQIAEAVEVEGLISVNHVNGDAA